MIWELTHGPIPDGLTIDHSCRHKPCLNTEHMELVTRQVNSARTRPSSPLYCRNGHPIFGTLGSWRRRADGKRRCITCHSAHSLKSWHKRKAARSAEGAAG